MNKVSIFEHPEFGRIRTLEIDGKIWFCASDVAAALGYSNPRDAVVRHCKPMGVVVYDTPTRSAVQKIKYISEGNVYRLIAGSKLPSAEKFESWIFDELVPETLKNGGYLLKKNGETDNELLYTVVTNRAGRGGRGTLVTMIRGTKSEDVIKVLEMIHVSKRKTAKEVTLDLLPTMMRIV